MTKQIKAPKTVKQNPAKFYRFTLLNLRLGFGQSLHVPQPQKKEDGSIDESKKPKYNAPFILELPEHNETAAFLVEVMKAVAEEKWPGKGDEMYEMLKEDNRVFLRKGSVRADKPNYDEAYKGNLFFNAGAVTRPNLFDRYRVDGKVVTLTEDDTDKLYGGCYVNGTFEVWAQDSKDAKIGKRINIALAGVQHYADGKRLSGIEGASEDEYDFDDQPAPEEADASGDDSLDFLS